MTDYRFYVLSRDTPYRYMTKLNNKDLLYEMHITKNMSLSEMKHEIGCGVLLICKWMILFDIPFRADKNSKRKIDALCYWLTSKWVSIREDIKNEQQNKCMKCGNEIINKYNIHHLITANISTFRYDKNNLIMVCEDCHKWIHSKKNKNKEYKILDPHNWDSEKLRQFKEGLNRL